MMLRQEASIGLFPLLNSLASLNLAPIDLIEIFKTIMHFVAIHFERDSL